MSVKRIVLVHYYVLSKHLLSKLLYFPLIKYLFYSFRKYGTKMIPISYTQYLNAIQMNRMHNNTNRSEDCIVSLVKSIRSYFLLSAINKKVQQKNRTINKENLRVRSLRISLLLP